MMLFQTGCIFPLLTNDLFSDLTPASFDALTGIKRITRLQKSVKIFAAGEMPRCVHILLKGQAQLYLNAESDLVRLVEPREIFGLAETAARLPYKMNLETISPCDFVTIDSEIFLQFLRDEPQVCFRLVKLLGVHLQKSCRIFCSSTY